jgi:hypothetical protein
VAKARVIAAAKAPMPGKAGRLRVAVTPVAVGGGGKAGGRNPPRRGPRRGEVIADLEANPGSKAGEVASRVGINPNHAQTILGNLVKQGVATKEGQQYTVVAGKA